MSFLEARAGCDVGLIRYGWRVSRAAFENEAAVAVSAVDIAMLVDLQKDARVTKCGRNAVARAIAGDSTGVNVKDFRRVLHEIGD